MNIQILSKKIAEKLNLSEYQVSTTIQLFDEGNSIPFIARYRKERTHNLDEIQLSDIQSLKEKYEEIDKRREAIIKALEKNEQLTETLKSQLDNVDTMVELEDIYLPYKPKRKTRAEMAKEKGLLGLAKILLSRSATDLENVTEKFINPSKEVNTSEEALQGARDIIAEWVNEHQSVRKSLRRFYFSKANLQSKQSRKVTGKNHHYENYYEYEESITKMPSHRILAMFRGENEKELTVKINVSKEDALDIIFNRYLKPHHTQIQVEKAIEDAYKRLLHPSLETEVRTWLKEKADEKAISVFAENVKQLLLYPPLGNKNVLAVDPGFRTGCKVVCLDKTGQLKYNETIYPHPPKNDVKNAKKKIIQFVNAYDIEAIAIGNGTAGRETELFIKSIRFDKDLIAVMVNENGASVYSASKIAREEFPEYDITVRGAVSIGRRLIDPLAELVKIDPKSIGVGQYQHDVNQTELSKSLKQTVEHCVNLVGVDVNTASKELLQHVSGIGAGLAENIVNYRNENGYIPSREALKNIPRYGAKAFEQSAGFLKVMDSENPLDRSAVHPESYHIVEKMAKSLHVEIDQLIENKTLTQKIKLDDFVTEKVGLPTLKDIISELEKPGRDPRKSFNIFQFNDSVQHLEDVKPGMILDGIVTNITAFGAFVDIGVHQDGLVHISHIANKFVKDPNDELTLNQKVTVKVLSVDSEKKRIQLSMKEAL